MGCSSAPACTTSAPSRCSQRPGSGSRSEPSYWLGVAAVAALLAYEHSLVRPGDLRRLDAAFFTVNGVISIVFLGFVLLDVLLVIHARAVEKRYGRRRALRPLDFELERGGFLVVTGANGSGKTTLLRLVAGLAAPTGGELEVAADRGGLGYLGHEPLLYRDLTALENLDLYGRLYRVPERRERAGMLLERFGLWDVRAERVASYSRGMVQRLALCRAAAARSRAARARRALHGARRRRSRAARPPASGSSRVRRPCS